MFAGDWDRPESWFWPGTDQIRPQMRVLQIIGDDGRPTGRLVYAKNEVQYAALRQEVRDNEGQIYKHGAKLVDIIYQ